LGYGFNISFLQCVADHMLFSNTKSHIVLIFIAVSLGNENALSRFCTLNFIPNMIMHWRFHKPHALLAACFLLMSLLAYSSTLMMEVTFSNKMLVGFQLTTWLYIAEDRTFHNPFTSGEFDGHPMDLTKATVVPSTTFKEQVI
jgi:hypothetical protein